MIVANDLNLQHTYSSFSPSFYFALASAARLASFCFRLLCSWDIFIFFDSAISSSFSIRASSSFSSAFFIHSRSFSFSDARTTQRSSLLGCADMCPRGTEPRFCAQRRKLFGSRLSRALLCRSRRFERRGVTFARFVLFLASKMLEVNYHSVANCSLIRAYCFGRGSIAVFIPFRVRSRLAMRELPKAAR